MTAHDPNENLRLYNELAPWWPLLSDAKDYAEEVESFLTMLDPVAEGTRPTMLELGAGGGNLASHMKAHYALTLSDRSPGMLQASRSINPELEHIEGDMRTLRLARQFDVVLIHDAIMYLVAADDVRAALATAAVHCRPGGQVLVAPDVVRESYHPDADHGGEDGDDGRALRFLEWSLPADPDTSSFEVVYAVVRREADGSMRMDLDRHQHGLFSEAEWLRFFDGAGLPARVTIDPWMRHVFVGRRT